MLKKLIYGTVLFVMAGSFANAETLSSGPTGVDLTVYNQNYGLVRESRNVDLVNGTNYIRVQDVSAQIDPTSIHFESKTAPDSVIIREQNYQYDVISRQTILDKSVGKKVTIRQVNPDGKVEVLTGTLLSSGNTQTYQYDQYSGRGYGSRSDGSIVIQTDRGILLNPAGEISVEELPEGLISKPALLWKLDSTRAGKHDIEVSYITNGITWKADYIAVVNADDTKSGLTGWVTLTNNTGTAYKNAGLQLMAGDVRKLQPTALNAVGASYGVYGGGGLAPAPSFTQESFFEYHLYTLKDRTTIGNNETKQLGLLSAADIPVKKVMIYDGGKDYWRDWITNGRYYRPGEGRDTSKNTKVNVMLEVVNSEKNNMGMPLPKGKIRVYKGSKDGKLQFIGEDEIDHTPKDEKIRLYVGDAFDVVGERKRMDYKDIATDVIEESFEITLRNHKETPVDVTVVERLRGDWTILEKSVDYTKKDAHTIEFPVNIPKDGEVKVTYRVRTEL